MLRLAAIGALGYAGYKYFQKNSTQSGEGEAARTRNAAAGDEHTIAEGVREAIEDSPPAS